MLGQVRFDQPGLRVAKGLALSFEQFPVLRSTGSVGESSRPLLSQLLVSQPAALVSRRFRSVLRTITLTFPSGSKCQTLEAEAGCTMASHVNVITPSAGEGRYPVPEISEA